MVRSQNATFRGKEPHTDDDSIPGASIARHLAAELSQLGWSTEDFDCWRDGGWMFHASHDTASLLVVLVPHCTPGEWSLQISPVQIPFFAIRWLGASPSASADEILRLAENAHLILSNSGMTNFCWCWDDFPKAGVDSTTPQAAGN